MINFENGHLSQYPYPWIYVEDVFDPETYESLKTEHNLLTSEPYGRQDSIYGKLIGCREGQGSNNYTLLKCFEEGIAPTWKQLYNFMDSDDFIKYLNNLCPDYFDKWGCNIDINKTHKSGYTQQNFKEHGNDFWVDIELKSAQGFVNPSGGYTREVHRDKLSRAWTYLFYFDDRKDYTGGEFVIWSSDKPGGGNIWEGIPMNLNPSQANSIGLNIHESITPKANTMVAFLATPWAWHSVPQMVGTGARNYMYGSLTTETLFPESRP